MAVIYVKEQGTLIRKSGGRIVVSRNAQPLMEFPVSNIEGIALMAMYRSQRRRFIFCCRKGLTSAIIHMAVSISGRLLLNLLKISSYVFPSMNFTIMSRKGWIMPGLS